MLPKNLHSWTLEPAEAIRLQASLRERLVLEWDARPIETVGGVDVSNQPGIARAAISVFRFPDLTPLQAITASVPLQFPYIPGLLAFREGPAILAAWQRLTLLPDLLMFDGQGIAHPRGIGIASLMGLWLERPTIGVAKSRLYGRHSDPGPARGDQSLLYDPHQDGRVIGAVLRTRPQVKPLFISPGHLIDVEHSVDFVLRSTTRYRLPEPTRWAHNVAGGQPFPPNPGHPKEDK